MTTAIRGKRALLAALIAISCLLGPARESWAGPQRDSVCQGCGNGQGCDPCPVGGGSSSTYSPPIAWGHTFRNNMEALPRECGRAPLCYVFNGGLAVLAGAIYDVPYYAVKGVGYGLYYGGIGLGKGAVGLGKGVAYVGTSIGHAVAAPFKKRPPKPAVLAAPATFGGKHAPKSRFIEAEASMIDAAPLVLDDRSELRKRFDDEFIPAAKKVADYANIADTHREGLAMSAELAGSAKFLDTTLGGTFRGVAVIDAAITAYEGNTAGAGGKLVGLGIGMIAKGPAYAGQVIASTAKNAMLGVSAGVYQAQGMTADEAAEMAAKDYETTHKNEKSAETRFWWGVTGL